MEDEDTVPVSALQHFLYCPRQCALIHIEQAWQENRQTAEGRLLHERADEPRAEIRHGVRTVTGMPVFNPELGISGQADVVEFHSHGSSEVPYPVEYKRGKPKNHRADEVQICAQALCLEYMFRCRVDEGALYYGKVRHRNVVLFDENLRKLTNEVILDTRILLRSGKTPTAHYRSEICDYCSLIDLCQPKILEKRNLVSHWLVEQLRG